MTTLPNCLLIVTAEVDTAVEADWNRWYDDVHLPDALACPGVLAGRRYVTSRCDGSLPGTWRRCPWPRIRIGPEESQRCRR